MYAEDTEGTSICPGEASCERFLGTGGKGAARVRNACHPCPMFPTKTDEGKKTLQFLKGLADVGMYIRRCRESGYPISTSQMTPLQFEALLMTDAEIEQQEIRLKKHVRSALIAGFGLKFES